MLCRPSVAVRMAVSTGLVWSLVSYTAYWRHWWPSGRIYPFEESWFGGTPEEIESIVSSWLSHPGVRKSWRFNELVTAIARLECEIEALIRQSSEVPAKKSHDDECHSSHSQLRRRRPYTADIHAEAGEVS